MNQETKELRKVELQYCVQCPTCNETFKIKPHERSFTQQCVFCRNRFQVVAKRNQKKVDNLPLGIGLLWSFFNGKWYKLKIKKNELKSQIQLKLTTKNHN